MKTLLARWLALAFLTVAAVSLPEVGLSASGCDQCLDRCEEMREAIVADGCSCGLCSCNSYWEQYGGPAHCYEPDCYC